MQTHLEPKTTIATSSGKAIALICSVVVFMALADPQLSIGQESKALRSVSLEFDPIEGATQYEVQVTRIANGGEREKPTITQLKQPTWTAKVAPGRYEMKLRSYDDRGVPGEWSEPAEFWVKITAPAPKFPLHKAKIDSKEEDTFEVNFEWVPTEGAEKYRLEIQSTDKKFAETFESDSTKKSVDLNVAKNYQWRVTAFMPGGEQGEVAESYNSFTLIGAKLDPPEIEKPPTEIVTEVNWDRPDKSEAFTYALFQKTRDNKKSWKLIDKKSGYTRSQLSFDSKYPSGRYKLVVQARAKFRHKSKAAKVVFDVKGGLRSPAAIEQAKLKQSMEKPTNFYAIASYFLTQMNYLGKSNETNSISTFDVVGGTGRIGVGYQKPDSKTGYFGIIDLSGFDLKGETYTYPALELHTTWKTYFRKTHQFKASVGLYMKEFPVLRSDINQSLTDVNSLNILGPHIGATYWLPFSEKLGLQLNSRVYFGLGGDAPNGESIEESVSFQVGALGSYRLSSSMMGFAGYAYRLDAGKYKAFVDEFGSTSFAQPGSVESIEIKGHYLNLVLEYSF